MKVSVDTPVYELSVKHSLSCPNNEANILLFYDQCRLQLFIGKLLFLPVDPATQEDNIDQLELQALKLVKHKLCSLI